jgi:pentapeptide MXKDX repeat protein
MKTWSSALALFVASAMLAGAAFAQQQMAPSKDAPKGKDSSTGAAGQSDAMKSDTKSEGAMKSDSATKSGESGRMAGGKAKQVKAAQQALQDKGHDPGAIDGVMGPKTQEALRDFQTKEGLKTSGRLDTETMTKLGIDAKAGAAATPSTAPSASPPTGASGTKK